MIKKKLMRHVNFLPTEFEEWLIEKHNYASSSATLYRTYLEKFLSTVNNLYESGEYNDYIIQNCIKKRSNVVFNMLKKFIDFYDFGLEERLGLVSKREIKHKLKESLVTPQEHKNIKQERRYLSEDQILDLINALGDEKHKVIALIQTFTGVRAGDVMRLKRDQLVVEEYEGKEVLRLNIIGKGGKRNVVYIHDETLKDYIINYTVSNFYHKDYLFLNTGTMNKRPGTVTDEFKFYITNYKRYWNDLKLALNMCNIDKKDFSTHDFRRCFARRVWTKYKDVQILQKILNHADPKTTFKYLNQSGLQNIDILKEMQNE